MDVSTILNAHENSQLIFMRLNIRLLAMGEKRATPEIISKQETTIKA
jgi:hypothetical protein